MNCENITISDASPEDLRAVLIYFLWSNYPTMESRKT